MAAKPHLQPIIHHGILAVIGPRTSRSLKLAVDTGATYTMLPPDLLLDIGYDHTLKCLGLGVRNVEVIAHHLPPESPVEGLLGLNVLVL